MYNDVYFVLKMLQTARPDLASWMMVEVVLL